MTDKPDNNKTKTDDNGKEYIKIFIWLAQKAKKEEVSFDQLMVYSWIYAKNNYAKYRYKNEIYGKRTLKALWDEIGNALEIYDVGDMCRQLEAKGWLKKATGKAYNGKRQKGYLCMLDKEQKAAAQANQQEMFLPDEETVVEVESALPCREYLYGGVRFYDDSEGNAHSVPTSAPPRPSNTAVWSDDPEGWFEPEEIPEREIEY